MKRYEAVEIISAALAPDHLVIGCNGMISRELFTAGDGPNKFYMIGSMGLASSMGLGLALRQPERTVVVIDGDGNVLMNMGTLANIAAAQARNLYHIVLDNGVHGSTGNQKTISSDVPLEQVAWACGYARASRVDEPHALREALAELFCEPGPAMLLVRVEPGNLESVGRVDIEPPDLARRFRGAATNADPLAG
jgi:thiamine pyrophosphate-dependent acetolactate synthase large subunit-like protein